MVTLNPKGGDEWSVSETSKNAESACNLARHDQAVNIFLGRPNGRPRAVDVTGHQNVWRPVALRRRALPMEGRGAGSNPARRDPSSTEHRAGHGRLHPSSPVRWRRDA